MAETEGFDIARKPASGLTPGLGTKRHPYSYPYLETEAIFHIIKYSATTESQ